MGRFLWAVAYLLSVHLIGLLVFTLFRLALYCTVDYTFIPEVAGRTALHAVAFVKGLWFDNVIACYILMLPLVWLWIVAGWLGKVSRWVFVVPAAVFVPFYALAFALSAANIPYFAYFFKVINSSIFNWMGYVGTTAGMVFGETSYYLPIAMGLTAMVAFGWCVVRLGRCFGRRARGCAAPTWAGRGVTFVLGAALVGLCLFGIRGRRGYNPIKVSQAYYCNDPFLNQLGVNPAFNVMTSWIDDNRSENRALQLMPADEALAQAAAYLGRPGMEGISPLARRVAGTPGVPRRNVVVILMESMSAHLMGAFGNPGGLTPVLDSLYARSLSFSHCYSAGIHTNHGLYATLYSFPAIMKRNAMKGSVIPVYSGLPTVLRQHGYHNMFFMTHESQYDNMNAFFRTNGFDDIYSQENYPSDKVVNGFGVQDDFLFDYALPVLDRQAATGQPFFGVLLTISNHPPYIIPPHFKPRRTKVEEQIVEYADWCVGRFMAQAATRDWFDNTLFVLLGDHGKLVGTPECESPESYNHIPLMFYGCGVEPRVDGRPCGQVDVAPTLLGMLGLDYTQNNFGIDLLREQRPCMYFTADNLVGARDSSHLYLYMPQTRQEFCYLRQGDGVVAADADSTFSLLRRYSFAMLQSAEHMVHQGQTVDEAR